ncbi:MAG: hypothetical protein QM692_14070 [Thermomicrobiales bacterium]
MDETRFDQIARAISVAGTRRRALGALTGVALGAGLAGILTHEDAEGRKSKAKKRRERKQKKRDRKKKRKCRKQSVAQACGTRCGTTVTLKPCNRTVTCPPCTPTTCDPACVAPLTCCNGVCVDTTRDRANCGACGVAVTASQLCVASAPQACDVTCTAGNNICASTDLQTAVTAGGTIYVCPGQYTGGLIGTALSTTIIGAGSGTVLTSNTVLDGNAVAPVFNGTNSTTLNMTDLRVQNGLGATLVAGGIGLGANADATLTRVAVTGNSHTNTCGAGITVVDGSLNLIDSLVEGNTTTALGGGVCTLNGGAAILSNTVVRLNTATGLGGGLAVGNNTAITLTNGTLVTGNTSNTANGGGGAYIDATNTLLTISADSSITGNTPNNCLNTGTINGTCTG